MEDDSFGFEFQLNETKKQSEIVYQLSESLLQEAPPITASVSSGSEEYGDVNVASLENVGSKGEIAISGTQKSHPDGSSKVAVLSRMYELGDSEIQELETPEVCTELEFSPYGNKGEEIGVWETQDFDGKPVEIGVINDNSLVETLEVKDVNQEIGCWADTGKKLNSRADEVVEENDKGKIFYSRKELKALSNEGLDGQKRRWVAVYSGLGLVIQKEYDGLAQQHQQQQKKKNKNKNKKKQMTLNVDPQLQSQVASVFFGEESSHAADYGIKNLKPMDPAAGLIPVDAETTGAIGQDNHMEDDDGDEAYDSIQKPAFVVTGEPDFNSGPPEDGLEYLRRVRWEAAQIPKVKVAKVEASKLNKMQTVYMPQVPDIPQCPAHLMPLKEWEGAFLADFSELRLALSSHVVAPEKEDSDGMPSSCAQLDVKESFNNHFESMMLENNCGICLVNKETHMSTNGFGPENCENLKTSVDSATTVRSGASTSYPTLSVMLRMSSVARASMLRKHIGIAEKASMLSKEDCMWLFALCAAVDWPVDADTCAALRSLLRKCASLRVVKQELDEEVIMLNILATIAGKHFGQSET